MYNTTSHSANPKRKASRRWGMLVIILMGMVVMLAIMTSCRPAPSLDEVITSKAVQSLGNMAVAAGKDWVQEVKTIDAELTDVLDRLASVKQVGKPALEWVQMMKDRAVRENWTTRIMEVMGDLSKLKNERYQVVKLQFISEMLSSGISYSSVIQVNDLASGQTTEYDELVGNLNRKIADLTYRRETLVKAMNTAHSTLESMAKQLEQQGWKVSKVNATTYTVRGQGLGMEQQQGLTVGQWTYSSDSEKMVPNDQAAMTLQKVLTGN